MVDRAGHGGPHSSAGARRAASLGFALTFALLTLALLALHTQHFDGRPYRQDEAWRVHGYLYRDPVETVRWVAGNIHPPGWAILSDVWVDLAGQTEPLTRFLSTLLTALTFALTYRLAADLFSREVGLVAVFLLGTAAFFLFYAHEFRPYAMLALTVVAAHLTFLRWLRRPDFRRALGFVIAGVLALYTHFFAIYALAALALGFIVFVRWNAGLYLRAGGLFAAVGLSYLGWLLPTLHALLIAVPGGLNYALDSRWYVLEFLYPRMTLRPQPLIEALLLASVMFPVAWWARRRRPTLPRHGVRFRFDPQWRVLYPLLLALLMLALPYVVNMYLPHLTRRPLLILYPALAVALAYGVTVLPRPLGIVVLLLIAWSARHFVDYEFTGHHAEVAGFMADDYTAGDPIIVNVPTVSRQIAVLYYVQERMPVRVGNDDLLQVLAPRQPYLNFLPRDPVNVVSRGGTTGRSIVRAFIGDADTVWYIDRDRGTGFSPAAYDVLTEQHEAVRQAEWAGDYVVIEFRRRPAPTSADTDKP